MTPPHPRVPRLLGLIRIGQFDEVCSRQVRWPHPMRQKQPDGGFGGVHTRRAAQKGLGKLVGAEVVSRHDVVVPSLVVGSVFPE